MAFNYDSAYTISWFYAAAFGRTPVPDSGLPDNGDLGGLTFWTDAFLEGEGDLAQFNNDVYAIADFFVQSTEFQAKYPSTLTNSEYVTALYNNMLGRPPEDAGLAFWVAKLDGGDSRGTVLADFANVPENQNVDLVRKAALDSFINFILADTDGTITPEEGGTWLTDNPSYDASLVDSTYALTAPELITEGQDGTFTLTASVVSGVDRTFQVSIAGNTLDGTVGAADLNDFTSPPTTVTLPAGETTVTLTLAVKDDGVEEGPEGFKVSLLQGATVVTSSAVVVINDAPHDTEAPVVTPDQTFEYGDGQVAGATIATVEATDNVGVTGFAIDPTTDPNGFFAIDETGNISLTDAGVASAYNNFSVAPNTVTLGVTATDAAGNVSTVANVVLNEQDVTPPAFTTAQVNGTTLVLGFNEVLDTTSGVPANSSFTGTQDVNGTVTNLNVTNVAISGSTVILTLGSSVPLNATVKVSYTPPATGPLQDAAGNDVVAIVNQTAQFDTTAPTLSNSVPVDNATNVSVSDNIVLTFSETVRAGTGNITIVNAANAADTRTISVTDTTQVTFSGSTVTINPTADLTTASNYYVNIANTAITDAIGNKFAGISDAATLNFSTPGGSGTGTTFTLTQGQDTVVGTANDDTINGFLDGGNVTWQTTDKIDGAAGVDTLTALGLTGTLDFTQTTNVEKFVIGTGAAAINGIDFSKTNAETSLTLQNPSQDVTVTNLNMGATGFDLAVNGSSGGKTFTFGFSAASTGGSNDVVRLGLNGVADGASLNIDGANNAIETLSITGTGANSKLGASTFSSALKTINVAGDVRIDLTATALAAAVTMIDASASSGGVRINHSANANTLTFTGGSGSDTLNIGANLTNADTLNGGSGTDTLQVSAALTAADVTKVSNFEVFSQNGGAVTQDWSLISSKFANHAAIDSAHLLTLNNIQTGLVVDVNVTGGSLTLGALASPSASDTVTVNLVGGLVLADLQRDADIETLTLNSQGTTTNTLTTVGAAMTNLAVTGGTGLTVGDTGSLAGTLDASAMTGALTATTLTTALTVLGGKAGDTITSGNVAAATTQTLSGNEGNDTITAAAAATAGATVNISGGAGNDTLTGPAAAVLLGTIDGGTGNDAITVGGGAGYKLQSTVTTVADADIVTGFTTATQQFDYNGALVNGTTTTVSGNVELSAGAASLNADMAAVLATNTSAVGYIVTQDLTGSALTALNNLAGASTSTLGSLYATFEGELITAMAGTVAGLDTVLSTTDEVLMVFDNGTNSVVVRVHNFDQSVANTLTAAEIDLVAVFNGTAALATGDFI